MAACVGQLPGVATRDSIGAASRRPRQRVTLRRMSEAAALEPPPPETTSLQRRILRIAAWIVGLLILNAVLQLVGVDITGWLGELWDSMSEISLQYIILGCLFQGAQTVLTALGWYGILRYAYPSSTTFLPVLAAYAVGVALNNVLPANLGTFVMLLMFVAVIGGATFPGVLAGYVVQKLFYVVIGTLIYLYLFTQVAGSFEFQFGNEKDAIVNHPLLVLSIIGRRDLPRRPVAPHLLAQGQDALGEGEAGRGYPWRLACLRRARAASPGRRVRSEGGRDHRVPRCIRDPRELRLGDERARIEPAREPAVLYARGRGREPGVQHLRARQLHGLHDRRGLLDRAAARHDRLQHGLRDHPRLLGLRLERRQDARQGVVRRGEGEGRGDEGEPRRDARRGDARRTRRPARPERPQRQQGARVGGPLLPPAQLRARRIRLRGEESRRSRYPCHIGRTTGRFPVDFHKAIAAISGNLRPSHPQAGARTRFARLRAP